MKIAILVLAHTDPIHISHLAERLSSTMDIFVHVDIRQDIKQFIEKAKSVPNCTFIKQRYSCYWGGFETIKATIELLKVAYNTNIQYDRYVFLQGLDYPIKTNDYITNFFDKNPDTNFCRGCNVTISKNKYFACRGNLFWFYDKPNFFKKCINKLNTKLPHQVKVRKGYIRENSKKYDLFWGSAQWAITRDCVYYILNFYNTHPKFNKYFKHVFPCDEIYFCTVIHNSQFSRSTHMGGSEPEKEGLTNWRNLHYFEYGKKIKTFTLEDFPLLINRKELFCRKTDTQNSNELIQEFDNLNKRT